MQRVVERALASPRAVIGACLALMVAVGWLYTVAGVGMEMSAFRMTFGADMAMGGMRMDGAMAGMAADGGAAWPAARWVLVFLMWWLMMVAMMLPSAAPTVLLYSAVLAGNAAARRPVSPALVFALGYLLAWAGFSAAATAAQAGLEASGLLSVSAMSLTSGVAGGAVLLAAGIYQFLPLKGACLRHCQAPADFIARNHRKGPLRMGLHHGTFCLGCCLGLMALLFVGGIMNLIWIVGLTALVAVEKLTRRGAIVARAAGLVLAVWGVTVLAGAA